jgi:hypothetical protein
MHLNKSHKTRTIIIVVVVVLFVLSSGALSYWLFLMQPPTNQEIQLDNPSQIEKSFGDSANPDSRLENDSKVEIVPSDGTANTVEPVITFIGESNGVVSIGALLNSQSVAGVCRLILSKTGEAPIVSDSQIVKAHNYTCGFDVNVPTSGGWTAELANVVGANESEPSIMEVPTQ